MSRRSSSVDSASLELLLDTMCNSFGGVMFISILLAVLTQFAEVKTAPLAQQDTSKLKQLQVETLEAEVARLKTANESQRRLIQALTPGDDPDALLSKLAQVVSQIEKLKDELQGLSKTSQACQDKADAANREKDALEAKVKKLRQAVENTRKAVDPTKQVERRQMRDVGPEKEVQKPTFFMIIKANRLVPLRVALRGQDGPVNEQMVKHARRVDPKAGPYEEYEALPGAGIPLDRPNWKTSPEIAKLLQDLPTRERSLQFAVYPDSYPVFIPVSDFFREKGYGWNWHIMRDADEPVRLAPGPVRER